MRILSCFVLLLLIISPSCTTQEAAHLHEAPPPSSSATAPAAHPEVTDPSEPDVTHVPAVARSEPALAESRPLTAEEQQLLTLGGRRYQMSCAACHLADGSGMEGVTLPLAASTWVNTHYRITAAILLHGKVSEDGMMPPMGTLDDRSLASILTYIRNSWGNQSSPVTEEMVAAVRAETADRVYPYTEEELRALASEEKS